MPRHQITTMPPHGRALRRVTLAVVCLACLLAGALPVHAQTTFPLSVPRRAYCTLPLEATADDRYLLIEGRYESDFEYRANSGIRLVLNNTLLDGTRIHGANTILLPKLEKNWEDYPLPRYATRDQCFAFPLDADYTVGNGPYRFNNDSSYIAGCPNLLQLDVKDIVKPGANTLTVTNGGNTACELRRIALAPRPEVCEDPIVPHPTWKYFAYDPAVRQRYQTRATDTNVDARERGYLLTALGVAEFLRQGGQRQQAVAAWLQALRLETDFPQRGEAAYRVAAERVLTGKWPSHDAEALVRRVARSGAESWAEFAQALLDLIEGKTTSSVRPFIRPRATAVPPSIDGVLDDPCWKDAAEYLLETPMGYGRAKLYRTRVRFAVAQDGVAVAFDGDLPEQTRWSAGFRRDAQVWEDNCVELFITPDLEMRLYDELDVSLLGARYDAQNRWWWDCRPQWDGDWRMANRLNGTTFAVEMLVPWSDLGLTGRPKSGHVCVITCARFIVDTTNRARATGFFTLTQHRDYDSHRMMDGALLILP